MDKNILIVNFITQNSLVKGNRILFLMLHLEILKEKMYKNKILGILASLAIILLFNSRVIARDINHHSSLLKSSFISGGRTFTGKDIANLFVAYNAGENYSVYGLQRALFFKDDHGNMYVVAIHEKTNTLMASKINLENMIKLDAALKPGFDSEIIAKLQKDDAAFALVFQPTAHLARSKSYAGFAEEVIDRDFPALSQLYNENSEMIEQASNTMIAATSTLENKISKIIERECQWEFKIVDLKEVMELPEVSCSSSATDSGALIPTTLSFILYPKYGWRPFIFFNMVGSALKLESSRNYEMHFKNKKIYGKLHTDKIFEGRNVLFIDESLFLKTSDVQEIVSSTLKLIISTDYSSQQNITETSKWPTVGAAKVVEILEDFRINLNADYNK